MRQFCLPPLQATALNRLLSPLRAPLEMNLDCGLCCQILVY